MPSLIQEEGSQNVMVNAYEPTMQKVMDNPAVRDRFYERSSTVTAPSRFQVFVCGDFNSKLGKAGTDDT